MTISDLTRTEHQELENLLRVRFFGNKILSSYLNNNYEEFKEYSSKIILDLFREADKRQFESLKDMANYTSSSVYGNVRNNRRNNNITDLATAEQSNEERIAEYSESFDQYEGFESVDLSFGAQFRNTNYFNEEGVANLQIDNKTEEKIAQLRTLLAGTKIEHELDVFINSIREFGVGYKPNFTEVSENLGISRKAVQKKWNKIVSLIEKI
jgi:hypothetical protein